MKYSLTDIAQLDPVSTCNLISVLTVKGVCIDSRSIKPGEMFIAIRGENHDGHSYIQDVLKDKPACVMVEDRWIQKNGKEMLDDRTPLIIVRNTLTALAKIAHVHRMKHKIPIIAVAGSNGKTTTKELIASVLSAKYKVLKTQGNLNNHIGVPLTLLSLRPDHEIAVVEMGTNHFGEVRTLCEIAYPTHGILTNIGKEHLEFFKSVQGVFKAETELTDWLSKNRANEVAFFRNVDDQFLKNLRLNSKSVSYSVSQKKCDYYGEYVSNTRSSSAILKVYPRIQKGFSVLLRIPGRHNAMNALAAATVGYHFEVGPTLIKRKLSQFKGSGKRTEILKISGITIINDSYNANPDSMTSAIDLFGSMNVRGKRIAILGDMRELGKTSVKEHVTIGKKIAMNSIDILFTIGVMSRHIVKQALIRRPEITARHFTNKEALVDSLLYELAKGDAILLKGSRGMKMEEVLHLLDLRLKQKRSA